jgi:16S rRNA (guanine966-N2)-methyltransferase
VRISGGDARGIKLKAPKGARPAAERVRHAVFASLAAHVPDAQVLDLYSGSGAYGLEAVSRGAAQAVLVDNAREAVDLGRANAKAAGLEDRVRVRKAPAARYLEREAAGDGPFDLVFVDPPYDERIEDVLAQLGPHLDVDGRLVLERRWRDEPAPAAEGLVVEADRRYGDTRVLVYRQGTPPRSEAEGRTG